jgi:hypothetical protein
MPRLSEAKKDVISCEKPRGSARKKRSVGIRMGQPNSVKHYYRKGPTQGTETSKYLQEKKTKVISQVVASEQEEAQTAVLTGTRGVVGQWGNERIELECSGKSSHSG